MRTAWRLSTLLFALNCLAELPPRGISVSTWVREDMFAGFIEDDLERFSKGMKKVEEILAARPKAADAHAWRGDGELYLAVKAFEQGRTAEFEDHYAGALRSFDEAERLAGAEGARNAVNAISGGGWTAMGDRLPEKHRREAWAKVNSHYGKLRESQAKYFDKLPVHMRGEVLAGLAQASERLGADDFPRRLQEVIERLPGTPYAVRAKRWQENPGIAARSSIACQSCHDAGRLDAVLAAVKP